MSALLVVIAYAAGVGTGILLVRMGIELEIEVTKRAAREAADQDFLPAE